MKRVASVVGLVITLAVSLGLGVRALTAQDPAEDPLKAGTVLGRAELVSAEGMEAILVLRELPPGGESGEHTQSGDELVYILKGSVILEVQGQDPVTVEAGETFHTAAGVVHNVKNASASAPGKALAFYIAKKGTALEGLSVPAE